MTTITLTYRCGCRREIDAVGLSQAAQEYCQRNAAKTRCFAYCRKQPVQEAPR